MAGARTVSGGHRTEIQERDVSAEVGNDNVSVYGLGGD